MAKRETAAACNAEESAARAERIKHTFERLGELRRMLDEMGEALNRYPPPERKDR